MGRVLLLLPMLMLASACRGVSAIDVASSFRTEVRNVRLRLPKKTNLDPARLQAGDMAGTVALAEQYLTQHPNGERMHDRYVRALLACAHLMHGDSVAARDVMAAIQPLREGQLAHENQVINATLHAVSASRAIDARNALEQLLLGDLTMEDFVRQYGSFVAITLPDPAAPVYDKMVKIHATRLRKVCFAEVSGDPREMEEVHERRTDLHRLIGEQLYNDAAGLMVALPEDRSAESDWLRFTGIGAFVSFGYLFHEVVPMRLSRAQKEWQLEQSYGLFQRTKAAARRLRGRPENAAIDDSLLNAEMEIRGWIETR